jgi:hypothetical protein
VGGTSSEEECASFSRIHSPRTSRRVSPIDRLLENRLSDIKMEGVTFENRALYFFRKTRLLKSKT